MSGTLSYDGQTLESLGLVSGFPEISILNSKPSLHDAPGRHGQFFSGTSYGSSTVTVQVAAVGTASERRDAFSKLGALLDVDGPKKLYLPDTPDRYYLAVPSGQLDLSRGYDAEWTRLEFTLTDPVAYATPRKVVVVPDGTSEITVKGTAPSRIDVSASGAADSGDGLWGLKLLKKYGAFVATAALDIGTSGTTTVTINSTRRTARVGAYNKMIQLGYDWLVVEPGTYRVSYAFDTNSSTKVELTLNDRWY